jgi:ribosomal-protein-serine acetyltransferase
MLGMFSYRIDDTLALTLLEPQDAARLYRVIDESRAVLSPWTSWAVGATLENQQQYIIQSLEGFARGETFSVGIEANGELVGGIGINYFDRVMGVAELGYWLGADAQGRGVMTRALKGFIQLLRSRYGVREVLLVIHPNNDRSAQVAERCGFVVAADTTRFTWLQVNPEVQRLYICDMGSSLNPA